MKQQLNSGILRTGLSPGAPLNIFFSWMLLFNLSAGMMQWK
jgi:hypothetical protein